MTDGPTGFHVAPITEDDMSRVTSILKRAADAIVGMSQLSQDVTTLRDTVNQLQADTERLRSQNNALDEALNYSRTARDQLSAKLSEVDHMLVVANEQAGKYMNERDKLDLANGQLQIDLDLTRKAKDDAEFHNLELEDKLKAAEAKLAKVAELHQSLFPPETVVVPIAGPTALNPAVDNTPKVEAAPVLNPQVRYMDPEPVEQGPETRDTWEYGYYWDHTTAKYWRNDLSPPAKDEMPF